MALKRIGTGQYGDFHTVVVEREVRVYGAQERWILHGNFCTGSNPSVTIQTDKFTYSKTT